MCYMPLISGRTSAATDFIVIHVPDISGGLKIWLGTDVTVSDPDAQRGPALPGLVKALVQPSFRWLQ